MPPVEAVPLGEVAPFFGNNAAAADGARARICAATGSACRRAVESCISPTPGQFDFGLGTQKEEYQRGFRDTVGIVSPEGVYLAGNGYWYPQFAPADLGRVRAHRARARWLAPGEPGQRHLA